jgi:hypothetical protein
MRNVLPAQDLIAIRMRMGMHALYTETRSNLSQCYPEVKAQWVGYGVCDAIEIMALETLND